MKVSAKLGNFQTFYRMKPKSGAKNATSAVDPDRPVGIDLTDNAICLRHKTIRRYRADGGTLNHDHSVAFDVGPHLFVPLQDKRFIQHIRWCDGDNRSSSGVVIPLQPYLRAIHR